MSLEGQRLGEFEILERLGQGGMGAVYKARQASLRRTVALKTLQTALAADAEYIARFQNEAVAAAALSHPNLVQVYSAGESDGLHWFAMEYIQGESAQARLKRKGRIEPHEAIAIAIHVATALDYGWNRAQLIHRDIKPDNIFLSDHGDVKLGDLGLAKSALQTQGLTVTGASMGTPHYISPEQAEGRKGVDLRSDIYSLGCTLFHMVSGQPPYAGESALAVMMKHVSAPVPNLKQAWRGCLEELARVVMKMMLKAPAARQQSYGEVIADLRRAHAALAGATVPMMAAVTQKPAPQQARREGVAAPRKRTLPIAVLAGGTLAASTAVVALVYFAPWKKAGLTVAERASAESIPSIAGLPQATKDNPFVNTLGMKFVPVPGTKVLFSIWETRVKDYAAYAKEIAVPGTWKGQNKAGTPVSDGSDHPVCAVSWEDANGFCQWLTEKERAEGRLPEAMTYRLPTDEEWSRAVSMPKELAKTPKERSGKGTNYPWGGDWPPTGKAGNYPDTTYHERYPLEKSWIAGYTDGFVTTAPVGSFPQNQLGLYDLGGNVSEWCEDLFEPGDTHRVLRGASWLNGLEHSSQNLSHRRRDDRLILLSSYRNHDAPSYRDASSSFRCVLAPTTSQTQVPNP